MRRQILQLAALLAGAGLLLLGNGLIGVLVPMRASLEGFPGVVVGLLSTSFSVGFLGGCLYAPRLLARVGHVRAFAVIAAVAASCLLVFPLAVAPAPWLALRAALGACNAGLLMTVESWIAERSSSEQRGQVFAAYMVLNLVAVTLGQLGLVLSDPSGHVLFVLAAIVTTLSLVPVGLTRTQNPEPVQRVRLQLGRLYENSPVAVAGCLVAGFASGAFSGLGVVYALELGLSVGAVAVFMSAAVVGGALLQLPVGRLSDRLDRRLVLAGGCAASAALGSVLALLPSWFDGRPGAGLLAGAGFAYGAAIFTIYGLATAHANDRAEPEEFVEVSSGLLLVWAVGAIVGPLAASLLMERVGAGGLFWTTAVAHGALGLFTLVRMGLVQSPRSARKASFELEPVGTRPTPVTILLQPQAVEPEAEPGDGLPSEPEAP